MECMIECQKSLEGCKYLEKEEKHCRIQFVRKKYQHYKQRIYQIRKDHNSLSRTRIWNQQLKIVSHQIDTFYYNLQPLYQENENPMQIGWLNSYFVEPLTRC